MMTPQISYVANAFYAAAAVLGLPSLLGTVFSLVFGIRLWLLPSPSASAPVKNPDAIIMILEGITRVVGAGAGLFGAVGKMMVGVVAGVSVVALILAVTFFYTGRGLHAHQGWARVVAGVLMGGLLLFSLLALVSVRMPVQVLPALFVIGTIYALWTVWHGYAV